MATVVLGGKMLFMWSVRSIRGEGAVAVTAGGGSGRHDCNSGFFAREVLFQHRG